MWIRNTDVWKWRADTCTPPPLSVLSKFCTCVNDVSRVEGRLKLKRGTAGRPASLVQADQSPPLGVAWPAPGTSCNLSSSLSYHRLTPHIKCPPVFSHDSQPTYARMHRRAPLASARTRITHAFLIIRLMSLLI